MNACQSEQITHSEELVTNTDIIRELPPWPHIDHGPARVHMGGRRYLFGRLVGATTKVELFTVLTPKGRVIQTSKQNVRMV